MILALTRSVCFAQLSGTYGGSSHSSDPTIPVVQLTRFTFDRNGNLLNFSEIDSWGVGAPTGSTAPPCPMSGSGTYALFNGTVVGGTTNGFDVASQGCPNGSANSTPTQLVIIPERGGAEFDYMNIQQLGPTNVVSVGHAIRK